MFALVLIVIAAALVVAAHFTDTIQYGYAGLCAGAASVALVGARIWLDRSVRSASESFEVEDADPVSDRQRPVSSQKAASSAPSMPASTGEDDEIVLVIPHRRRFHTRDCSLLDGRQSEELTHAEAHDEGFTACTVCGPSAGTPKSFV